MKKLFKIIGVADIIAIISFAILYIFNKAALFSPIIYQIECVSKNCGNLSDLPKYEITTYCIAHLSVIGVLTFIEIVLFIILIIKMKSKKKGKK